MQLLIFNKTMTHSELILSTLERNSGKWVDMRDFPRPVRYKLSTRISELRDKHHIEREWIRTENNKYKSAKTAKYRYLGKFI